MPREFWTNEPHNLEVWMYAPALRVWTAIGLILSEANDKVRAVSVVRGLRPDSEMPAKVSADSLAGTLNPYFDEVCAAGLFSGVVQVSCAGETLFEGACGQADRSTGRLNTVQTRFSTASVTKSLTALAVSALVDAGRLSFADPIGDYLPELPSTIGQQVTIHDLLTHTSGVELDHIPAFMEERRFATSLEELLAIHLRYYDSLLVDGNLIPSGEHDYTNEGFDLAGLIVERVSGRPFLDYIVGTAAGPSGLRITTNDLCGRQGDVARGYTHYTARTAEFAPDTLFPDDPFRNAMPMPSASLYLRLDEVAAIMRAMFTGEIVSDSVRTLLLSPHSDVAGTDAYGYGFELSFVDDRQDLLESAGHTGGDWGGSAMVRHFPSLNITIVILSNERFRALAVGNYLTYLISSSQ